MYLKKGMFVMLLIGMCTGARAQTDLQVMVEETLTSVKHEQRISHRRAALEEESKCTLENAWADGKKDLQKIGLDVGVDVSYLAQRVSPGGKQTAVQGVYYPYLTWNLFQHRALGSGQLNVNYTLVRYWGTSASALQTRAKQAIAFNDYSANQEFFSQFSYTHTLPGKLNWMSFTVGQFPLYNFDGTNYLDNQQTALMNFALSQNATSAYPTASLGAYMQAQLKNWTLAAGYQDGTNISGQTIQTDSAFDGKYTGFVSVAWTPQFNIGAGQYSALYYYQPSVTQQPGNVNGWSLNMQQNIGEKWVLFSRANGASGHVTGIKNSYALGGGWINPLTRNSNDVILLGVAYNRLNEKVLTAMYPSETAVELAWVWGIGKLVTLTPDVQFYPRASLSEDKKFVTVVGIRTTVML